MSPDSVWNDRAAQAERGVLGRHLRRVVGLPGTRLGVVSWPARPGDRLSFRWHFWWQAHLLDCSVDAWLRAPGPARAATVRRIVRSIRLRNLGVFTNEYYDDMAWIGLALGRAVAVGGDPRAVRPIVTRILDSWSPPTGGIPWRVGDDFFNAPANGPASILLSRTGFSRRAEQMADWMDANLRVPGSDLIADGFHPGEILKPVYFTYCQGVVLGAELELGTVRHRRRVHRLVAAIDADLTAGGVLTGHGGGNGGLFTGILVRYLAAVAHRLPDADAADRRTRAVARRLVLDSAQSAWAHRIRAPHGPLFSPDWSTPAVDPRSTTARPGPAERDLSVQLSGWMLMEAAAFLHRHRDPVTPQELG